MAARQVEIHLDIISEAVICMNDPSVMISALSLITAIIVAIAGGLRGGRAEIERYQKLTDSVDNVASGVSDLREVVDRMDGKLDRHDGALVRLETRLDEQEKRIEKVENRCERHFGESTH